MPVRSFLIQDILDTSRSDNEADNQSVDSDRSPKHPVTLSAFPLDYSAPWKGQSLTEGNLSQIHQQANLLTRNMIEISSTAHLHSQ